MKIYKKLAQTINARNNCIKSNNTEWEEKHQETIDNIMENAPSGSGFDSGTQLFTANNKLQFETSFHHMNENGYYDGWTKHMITVVPELQFDFILKISGKNKNDIKDYISDVFYNWLNNEFIN